MDKSNAIAILGALAQDTRLEIFRHLAQAGPQPAGQVGEQFGLPLATLSFHLKTLQQAGLLDCRREGRQLIYQARCDAIVELMAYLTEHCCNLPVLAANTPIPVETLIRKPAAMNQDAVYNVLFLCTGNSARSILAEATMNHLGQGRFRAFSAGSFPTGKVNPYTLKLLELQGIPTEGLRSKSWDEFAAPDAPPLDFVFTVCDNAAGEVCPIWPGQPMTAHWGVEDPAAAEGDDAQKMLAFRKALRELENRIRIFMNLPIRALDKIKLKSKLDEIGRTTLEGSS
ncbi:MAG: metalloregulator ArsR/SmtB family transcription factor [Candidatus Contendobacter sp.]|nr:metalloregulator ArsR/SmtB family transcription factor [Candidatus Contendobacter sp.]MDG4557435.1 metalloregulator ArsR/SmtB family transcription factor [Candidatus Contendobacter sp.]